MNYKVIYINGLGYFSYCFVFLYLLKPVYLSTQRLKPYSHKVLISRRNFYSFSSCLLGSTYSTWINFNFKEHFSTCVYPFKVNSMVSRPLADLNFCDVPYPRSHNKVNNPAASFAFFTPHNFACCTSLVRTTPFVLL